MEAHAQHETRELHPGPSRVGEALTSPFEMSNQQSEQSTLPSKVVSPVVSFVSKVLRYAQTSVQDDNHTRHQARLGRPAILCCGRSRLRTILSTTYTATSRHPNVLTVKQRAVTLAPGAEPAADLSFRRERGGAMGAAVE